MSSPNKNTVSDRDWEKLDAQFALTEKKKIQQAINRSDTEKFYLFTRMLRITRTLKNAKTSGGH